MANDYQLVIQEQHRNQSIKIVYYIIALCVASIGFSVTQTMGASLNYFQIPLGLAVICWGVSIYIAIDYLYSVLLILQMNNDAMDHVSGK